MLATRRTDPLHGLSLDDAREALRYWEARHGRLPRWSVHRRREAREMAARWRARVEAAERARYGPGVLGALAMLALERRFPEATRHAGRRAARLAAGATVTVALTLAVVFAAAAAALVELLAAVLRALG